MSTIDGLNTRYISLLKNIDIMQSFADKIACEQNAQASSKFDRLSKSVNHLQDLTKTIDCHNYMQLEDVLLLGKQYLICADAINKYKTVLLDMQKKNKRKQVSEVTGVVASQEKYDVLKDEFTKKYGINIDSLDILNRTVAASIGTAISPLLMEIEKIKEEAHQILSKNNLIELKMTDELTTPEDLPETMLIGRSPLNGVSLQLLKDIGVTNTYQDINIDLKAQGNILIKTEYEKMNDNDLDEFVIAYILKYIEIFPLGMVNVHIFDQNTNHLYKRLCNNFQTENAGEVTKKVVQIHTDIRDLSALRDVNCEDIFKKTDVAHPDLFSIYEDDKTDPFNLIILRDGFIDGNGYASTEILETINSMSQPGNIGHKCGIRFLIIDNSKTYEKQVTGSVKHLINQIQQNSCITLDYVDANFLLDGKQIEVLHVYDELDIFVQNRSKLIANAINCKEQSYVTIAEVAAGETDTNLGSIMYIPIGKAGSNAVELPLSCKDENGTVAGQCIGYMAIGQSGSGKSSFFHSLVLNGCMKYSPKDLQFWLLDFKNGGASSKYSNSGLPHIRMIAENNKIDDALCLFQMVLEEMERRSKAFNNNNSDNIVDYNRKALEKGLEYFPRIIIAIDEVQEIFREENASVLQKLVSSISTRMRSAGMHFVMVAQNLSEGKSYMLKDAFLPSATGRICFRVAQDIPRDSGFEEDFVQRKKDISDLKTGEAYVSYGKDTIKKVKMAYTSPDEMHSTYFKIIRNRYPEYDDMKPLVIGSKKRLTINSHLQGRKETFADEIQKQEIRRGICSTIIGEDVYRMSPLSVNFSQHENSSVLILGSDKQIASSLCASFAMSLVRQNVKVHLFNADRTKVQEDDETVQHAFMYVCQKIGTSNSFIKNYRLNKLKDILRELYGEYLKRQTLVQQAEDEDPEFDPLFMIINDLFGIESFVNNEMVESGPNQQDSQEVASSSGGFKFDFDIFENRPDGSNENTNQFRENVQNIISTLVKNGWRYNIHLILAIKGDPSTWRNSRVVSEVNNAILFNTTDYSDQFGNSYYLKEMLKNISNDEENETMAVWVNKKTFSKIRPIIYKLSSETEKILVEKMTEGE